MSSRVIGTIVNAALRIKVSHKGVEMSASASDTSTDALNKQTKAVAARALHLMAQIGSYRVRKIGVNKVLLLCPAASKSFETIGKS